MNCQNCGASIQPGQSKCFKCGSAVAGQQQQVYQQQTTQNPPPNYSSQQTISEDEEFRRKIGYFKPYYQTRFTQIYNSKGVNNGGWNWCAFLFGCIWALTKGLWVPTIIWIVLSIVSAGGLGIVSCIYFGIRGNKLYYDKEILQKNPIM